MKCDDLRLISWTHWASRSHLRCTYSNSSRKLEARVGVFTHLGGAHGTHSTFPSGPRIQNWPGRAGKPSSHGIPRNPVGKEHSVFGEQKVSCVVKTG